MNVCPDGIFWISKPLTTKFGMVMHHHEPEGHGKRFVCCFEGQGHSKGWYDQSMTVSTVSSELLILLLPNSVWKYIIISQNVLWSNGIVVVKVTVNFKMLMNVWPDDFFGIANLLLPNLVWRCIIMSQIVFQNDWFAVFKVKVTVKDHVIKIWPSNISSELLILLQQSLV